MAAKGCGPCLEAAERQAPNSDLRLGGCHVHTCPDCGVASSVVHGSEEDTTYAGAACDIKRIVGDIYADSLDASEAAETLAHIAEWILEQAPEGGIE